MSVSNYGHYAWNRIALMKLHPSAVLDITMQLSPSIETHILSMYSAFVLCPSTTTSQKECNYTKQKRSTYIVNVGGLRVTVMCAQGCPAFEAGHSLFGMFDKRNGNIDGSKKTALLERSTSVAINNAPAE